MDEKKNTPKTLSDAPKPGQARRDLILGLGAFLLFLVVSMGILIALNPAGVKTLLARNIKEPSGEQPIEITLMHTNDTWGYTDPCG